jgi:tellurite resistance protein TerC
MDVGVVLIVLQLIYLEGILSIDNAAVLGAMVSHLPRDEPVPWPSFLRFLQRPIHRLLGGQRLAALKVGLLGAYLGRGSMLFIASWVVRNRWLLLLGGLYLIKLAADHLGDLGPGAAGEAAHEAGGDLLRRGERSFWSVVLAVELADLAFSLDNVVAAVALSRELWVVFTGVALGIITMRFAAGIFVWMIQRYPVLEAAAYLLVLNIGLELLLEDLWHIQLGDAQKFLVSVSTLVVTVTYGQVPALQRIGRTVTWPKRILGAVSLLFLWVLKPLAWLFGGTVYLIRALAVFLGPRARLARTARPAVPQGAPSNPHGRGPAHPLDTPRRRS